MHIMCDYYFMRNRLIGIKDPNRLKCYGLGTIIPFVLFCISFFCLWMGSLFFNVIPLATRCKLEVLVGDFVIMIVFLKLGRRNSLSDKTLGKLKDKQSQYSRNVRGLLLAFLTEENAKNFSDKYEAITAALNDDDKYASLEKEMTDKLSNSKTRIRLLNEEVLADKKEVESAFTVNYAVCFISALLSNIRSAVESISNASSETDMRNRILVQVVILLLLLVSFIIVLFSNSFIGILNRKKARNLGNAHYELELLLSDDKS